MRVVRSSDALMQNTGEGDAHVFSPFDNSGIMNAIIANKNEAARKKQLEAEAKENKQKELFEYYKYKGPEILDQHYVPSIQNKTKEYLDDVSSTYLKGGANEEDRARLAQKRNEIEYSSQKFNALKKRLDEDVINIQKYPDYYNKEDMIKDRIGKYHPDPDERGNVDVSGVDPDKMMTDPSSFIKEPELYKSLTKDIQKSIESGEWKSGEDIRGKESGSIFWKPEVDKRGNATGRRVPGVSDETVNFYMEHPDVMMSANREVSSKIKNDAEILKNLGDQRPIEEIEADLSKDKEVLLKDHIRKQLENVNEVSVKRTLQAGAGGNGDDDNVAKVTWSFDQDRNVNTQQTGETNSKIVPGWVPQVGSLYDDKDKKFRVDAPSLINVTTNKWIKEPGSKELYGVELQLRPYKSKSKQPIIVNKKDNIVNEDGSLKDPDMEFEWFISGTYKKKNAVGKEEEVHVLIPYKDVKPQMKSVYGIDLDERPPSEYSDLELKSFIKTRYSHLSPEEKVKKFLELRNN
jgi:hypothetical protein